MGGGLYISEVEKKGLLVSREREENLEMEIKLELREILVGEGWGKRGI